MYLLVQRGSIPNDVQIFSSDTDAFEDILKAFSKWKEKEKRPMLEAIKKTLQGDPIWSDENHPELSTHAEIDHYIQTLRESWRISREGGQNG